MTVASLPLLTSPEWEVTPDGFIRLTLSPAQLFEIAVGIQFHCEYMEMESPNPGNTSTVAVLAHLDASVLGPIKDTLLDAGWNWPSAGDFAHVGAPLEYAFGLPLSPAVRSGIAVLRESGGVLGTRDEAVARDLVDARGTFGARVRDARRRHGLNQTAVAAAVGTSQGYLSQIERAKWEAGQELRERLCAFFANFGTSRDWLLTGDLAS